jgi:hypothetical protein
MNCIEINHERQALYESDKLVQLRYKFHKFSRLARVYEAKIEKPFP